VDCAGPGECERQDGEDAEQWVDLKKDRICLTVTDRGRDKIYCAVQAKGYLTTRTDPDGERQFTTCFRDEGVGVSCRRLDQDTSGLLILTNDSELAEHLTNPTTTCRKRTWSKRRTC